MKTAGLGILFVLLVAITVPTLQSYREDTSAAEKIEEGIEDVGDEIEEGAEELEDEIDDATDDN